MASTMRFAYDLVTNLGILASIRRRCRLVAIILVAVVGCGGPTVVTRSPEQTRATAPPTTSPAASPTLSPEALELSSFAAAYTKVRSDQITGDGYRDRNPGKTQPPLNLSISGIRTSLLHELFVAGDTEQQIGRLQRTALTRSFVEAALAAIQTDVRSVNRRLDATYMPENSKAQVDLYDEANVLHNEAARLWRNVADQIEDALRNKGLQWPTYRPG